MRLWALAFCSCQYSQHLTHHTLIKVMSKFKLAADQQPGAKPQTVLSNTVASPEDLDISGSHYSSCPCGQKTGEPQLCHQLH